MFDKRGNNYFLKKKILPNFTFLFIDLFVKDRNAHSLGWNKTGPERAKDI